MSSVDDVGGHFICTHKERVMNMLRVTAVGVAVLLAMSAGALPKMIEFDVTHVDMTKVDSATGRIVVADSSLNNDATMDPYNFLLNTGEWQVRPAGLRMGNRTVTEAYGSKDNRGLGANGALYSRGDSLSYTVGGSEKTIASPDRPYLFLDQFGYILSTAPSSGGPDVNGNVFSTYTNVNTVGYSEVGYYYIDSDADNAVQGYNVGLGSIQDAQRQNVFMYFNGTGVASITAVYDGDGTSAAGWKDHNDALTVPRDEWFMLTKVFDFQGGKLYYYLNDNPVPMLTSTFSDTYDPATATLHGYTDAVSGNVGDHRGGIGGNSSRQAFGIGFSYYAMYEGQLKPQDIANIYTNVVLGIPEPATMSLLALGGLALLRRRK
jgi:hypothetical protein